MIQEIRQKRIRRALLWTPLPLVVFIISILDSDRASALFTLAIGLTVLLVIWQWIEAFQTKYMAGIKDFCERSDNSNAMMIRIDDIWRSGTKTKFCRMDEDYLVWCNETLSAVISLSDAVQMVCNSETINGKNITLWLGAALKDGTIQIIPISSSIHRENGADVAEIISEHITKYHPEVIQGVDEELEVILERDGIHKGFPGYIQAKALKA